MGVTGARLSRAAEATARWAEEELAALGPVSARKMFGGFGVFLDGVMFAIVDPDGDLFYRTDERTEPSYVAGGSAQHPRMPYWSVDAGNIELTRNLTAQFAELKSRIDAVPGAIGQHFYAAIDSLEPTPAHLPEVMAHADDDDCPTCMSFKAGYDAKLREALKAEQAATTASAAGEAKMAEPVKPAPVVPRAFDDHGELDFFAVGAYGMESILDEATGLYAIKVKPGDDNAELAKEAIADGILPETCVIRIGNDGKTPWICDPEPKRAPAA